MILVGRNQFGVVGASLSSFIWCSYEAPCVGHRIFDLFGIFSGLACILLRLLFSLVKRRFVSNGKGMGGPR